MTLRLTDGETDLLREQAARERRSMHEVARLAVLARAAAGKRAEWIAGQVDEISERDAELLARLAK
jgi:hypothetical protein